MLLKHHVLVLGYFRKYNNFEKCTSIFLTYFDCVLCITSHILRIGSRREFTAAN